MLQSLDILADLPARFTDLEIEDTGESIIDRIRQVTGPRGTHLAARADLAREQYSLA